MKSITVTTCCPECHNETLQWTIDDGGKWFDGENTGEWASGDAKCTKCGWEGFYSDSSH